MRKLEDDLLAEIKQLASEKAISDERFLRMKRVVETQLLDERKRFRFVESNPNPNSAPVAGAIAGRVATTNSVRIHTILIVFDTTIGALTLQLDKWKATFANNTFGYIELTEVDFKVGNGDTVMLTAATWTAPKVLALALFGEEVGDALWIA